MKAFPLPKDSTETNSDLQKSFGSESADLDCLLSPFNQSHESLESELSVSSPPHAPPTPDSSSPICSSKKRKLSADERQEMLRHRAIRNRASAQESRQKKRKLLDTLQNSNKQLEQENSELKTQIQLLQHQNSILNSQMEAIIQAVLASCTFNTEIPCRNADSAVIAVKFQQRIQHLISELKKTMQTKNQNSHISLLKIIQEKKISAF